MWTFEQTTGKQIDPDGVLVGIGYAGGNCGLRPDGVNNPVLESVVDVGPLPSGVYTRGDVILRHPRLGNYVIPLTPDGATRAKIIAYGRDPDSFFEHGDSIALAGLKSASDGCIIQALDVRQAFGASLDRGLQVVAGLPRAT